MNCSDCQKLREQYDSLWEDYFTAMSAFMALRQTARRAEYVQLGETCQSARARCEEARLILQSHEQAHLQSKSAWPAAETVSGSVPPKIRSESHNLSESTACKPC